tara:strand:- start:676 stop:837 length:162 start_codon:yes stop_codon:yes gene_type:complete
MQSNKNRWKVEQMGNGFYVVWGNNECGDIMPKRYATEKGAQRAADKINQQSGL